MFFVSFYKQNAHARGKKSLSNAVSFWFFLQLISCVTECVSSFEEPPQPLSWTFLIPKLLFLSTVCAAEALKDIKVSPRWRTIFDNADLDTYWPVRISSLLRKLLNTLKSSNLSWSQRCPHFWTASLQTQNQSQLFNWSPSFWGWTCNPIA